MGDRGNIAFITDTERDPIVLYTHWYGSEMEQALRDAVIAAEDRWGDDPYCSRVLLHGCLISLNAKIEDPAGYGISVGVIGDNEYDIIVVDVPGQKIWKISEGAAMAEKWIDGTAQAVSFVDFAAGTRLPDDG